MNDIRLVQAPLEICFEEAGKEDFEREYNLLSQSDDDPMGHWLRVAKARGDTGESDQVLLTLLVELHRKIDSLSAYIKNESQSYVNLNNMAKIDAIAYEHFSLSESLFFSKKLYYGRILLPVFPKRNIAVFFKAIDGKLAKIVRSHEKDIQDWSAYIAARERVMIREMKAKKHG